MTDTDRITPIEAGALVEAATGVPMPARRLLSMSRGGRFPAPIVRVHRKMIYYSRAEIEAWLGKHFPDAQRRARTTPDTRRVERDQTKKVKERHNA